jgi:acetylornithine deacetylase
VSATSGSVKRGRAARTAARDAAAAGDPRTLAAHLAALVRSPSITGSADDIAGMLADRHHVGVSAEHDPAPTLTADPAEHDRQRRPGDLLPGPGCVRAEVRRIRVEDLDRKPCRLESIGEPATWTADPFGAEIGDGELYGRGANDMKGGVAAILGALRSLKETGLARRLGGELVVALVPSEEDGGQGTLAAIRAGATGDLAIIPEPSMLDVVVAHAGAITFRLEVPGRAAHASKRREGVSALAKLQVLVEALEADETRRNQAETDPLMTALGLPYPTIIGTIRGGEWASTVIDKVVVEGRYGVRLGQSPEDAFAELRAAIDAACDADDFLRHQRPTLELTGARFGSARVPSDHRLPVALADTAESITGRRPALLGVPYGADMRLFIDVGGTPCVMFGPGDVRLAHGADERVPLAEVEACARVLAAFVVEQLGVTG